MYKNYIYQVYKTYMKMYKKYCVALKKKTIEKKTRIRFTRKRLPNAGSAQGCTRILLQRDVGKATSRTRPIHSKKTMWCTRSPHKAAQDHPKPHKAAQGQSGSETLAQGPHKALHKAFFLRRRGRAKKKKEKQRQKKKRRKDI